MVTVRRPAIMNRLVPMRSAMTPEGISTRTLARPDAAMSAPTVTNEMSNVRA